MKNKKFYKKILIGAFAAALAGLLPSAPAKALLTGGQVAQDGQYTWDASVVPDARNQFRTYKVTVTLTVKDGAIADIAVTPGASFAETSSYFYNKAKDNFCMLLKGKPATEDSILQWDAGSDAVTGASCTARGIQNAAQSAIQTANQAATPTATPTAAATPTVTAPPTATVTAIPTAWPTTTPIIWPTVPPKVTPTPEATITATPAATETPGAADTGTPAATETETPGAAITETPGATETETPGAAETPQATAALKKPTVSISAGKKAAALKWKKIKGATGYQICRAKKKSGLYTVAATTRKLSYKDTKLKKGSVYYYKIRAYQTVNGERVYGGYSAVKSAKIK